GAHATVVHLSPKSCPCAVYRCHQHKRPTLLKRKRVVSEDENEEVPSKRVSIVPEEPDSLSDDILGLFDLDTENSENKPHPHYRKKLAQENEIDETWIMANETIDIESNEPPSGGVSSELDSEGDIIRATPVHPSWSQFRGMSCVLTPSTDRVSPLPVPKVANPTEVWELMCRKDEISTHERDEDVFSKHPGLQPRMRAILLDWLIEVCEVYKMHRETYHLAIDFIDRYCHTKKISHFETVMVSSSKICMRRGVTCLFIAAKVEEIYPPKIHEFAFVTDGACTEAEILDMELVILKALNWNLSPVTVNNWLNMYMQLCCDNRKKSSIQAWLSSAQSTAGRPSACLDEESLKFPYSWCWQHLCTLSHLQQGVRTLCFRSDVVFLFCSFFWLHRPPPWALKHMNIENRSLRAWLGRHSKVLLSGCLHLQVLVREEGQSMVLASSIPHIVLDDSHNIQTHIVDLQMLLRAVVKLQSLHGHQSAAPLDTTFIQRKNSYQEHKKTPSSTTTFVSLGQFTAEMDIIWYAMIALRKRKCYRVPISTSRFNPSRLLLLGNTTKQQALEELRDQIEHAINDVLLATFQMVCHFVRRLVGSEFLYNT
ncbi:hypothetical protein L9F63_026621, partial [Diploptera punctata]